MNEIQTWLKIFQPTFTLETDVFYGTSITNLIYQKHHCQTILRYDPILQNQYKTETR